MEDYKNFKNIFTLFYSPIYTVLNQSALPVIMECFKQVLAVNEQDKAAQYYIDKAVQYIIDGVGKEWNGVEEMVAK